MSANVELDEARHNALQQVARRRKVPMRRLLERAVDEFIERAVDEELLESSSRTAHATGLREKDAVTIVREWRKRRGNNIRS
jgi:predicted transcriptional regulator